MIHLLDDLPTTLVALALIAADVTLHLVGHGQGAMPFDEAIPVLVAVFIGGRVSATASKQAQDANPPPAQPPAPAVATPPPAPAAAGPGRNP